MSEIRRFRYTPREKRVMAQLYGKIPASALAERLSRSVGSLIVVANRLGLRRWRERHYTEEEDKAILLTKGEYYPMKQLAADLQVTHDALRHKYYRLKTAKPR
jgi:hypothetical protein